MIDVFEYESSLECTIGLPYKRVKYSKLRLSTHTLRIEIGRWSRTPRDKRLCRCLDDELTEEHVLLLCVETNVIRQKFEIDVRDISDLFLLEDEKVTNLIFEVMKLMEP